MNPSAAAAIYSNRKPASFVKEPVVQLAKPPRASYSSVAATSAPSASSGNSDWKKKPPKSKNRVYVRPGVLEGTSPKKPRQQQQQQQPASSRAAAAVTTTTTTTTTTTAHKTIIGVNRAIPCTFMNNPKAVLNVILTSPPSNHGEYPSIADHLSSSPAAKSISILQIAAREDFDGATEDLANAIVWLVAQSDKPIVLIGWAYAAAAIPWVTQMFQYDPKRIPAVILLSTIPEDRTLQALSALSCERLLIHGQVDQITSPQTMTHLVDQCATGLRYLRILEGADATLKSQEQPLFAVLDEFSSYLLQQSL